MFCFATKNKSVNVPVGHFAIALENNKCVSTYQPGIYDIDTSKSKIKIIKKVIIRNNQYGLFIVDKKYVATYEQGSYDINKYLLEEIIIKQKIVIPLQHIGIFTKDHVYKNVLPPGVYNENYLLNEKVKKISIVDIISYDVIQNVRMGNIVIVPNISFRTVFKIIDPLKYVNNAYETFFGMRTFSWTERELNTIRNILKLYDSSQLVNVFHRNHISDEIKVCLIPQMEKIMGLEIISFDICPLDQRSAMCAISEPSFPAVLTAYISQKREP
jgi:hypothetical protein